MKTFIFSGDLREIFKISNLPTIVGIIQVYNYLHARES